MTKIYLYDLYIQINKKFQIYGNALYPVLRRLEISGCLENYNFEFNYRLRKQYHITVARKIKTKENEMVFAEVKV